MLDIYAGKTARTQIGEHGFSANLFTAMFGASGGPKWFTLFGLDKYIFGEYFRDRTQPLDLIGSSAGSFRFAALSQKDPIAGISLLAKTYSETVYSQKANAQEVTDKAKELIAAVYTEEGIESAVNNPIFRPHFIVAKCLGLTASENKIVQMAGLLSSIALNRFDRGLLAKQYQRFVFHSQFNHQPIEDAHQFSNQYVPLSNFNFKHALLASGSIPMVMEGVSDIPDAPAGMYRDGGIIDYHFDVNLPKNKGLILYPHFNSQPKAGWFDKNLKRGCDPAHYDNVVLLTPSCKFIEQLPFSKIPDRKDFTDLDASTRIRYWKNVLSETDRLAESLDTFIQKPSFEKIIAL